MTHLRAALLSITFGFLIATGAFWAGRWSAPKHVEYVREAHGASKATASKQTEKKATAQEDTHVARQTGPKKTTRFYPPTAGCAQGAVASVTEEGPSREDSTTRRASTKTEKAKEQHAAEGQWWERERATVVAAPAPHWAVGASAGWAPALRLPGVPERVEVELSRRLFRGLWVTAGASVSPSLSSPTVIIGLRKEF